MIQSMTALASRTGHDDLHRWTWEIRGVNARGLDLRLRVPEGLDGLEAALRARIAATVARGNVSLTLRLTREEGAGPLVLDPDQLERVLGALNEVQERAYVQGVTLAQATAADVLAQRGVIRAASTAETDGPELTAALMADFEPLLTDFAAARAAEGAALREVLLGQLAQIEALVTAAIAAAEARRPEARAALTAALRRVIEDAPEIDEPRVAAELALLAVKADITEELDRLRAHVVAARGLCDQSAPAGRKLDFLAQEFNREANTLCSKAQSPALTAIGLDLKAVIDQMREQVQNVE